MTMEHNGVTYIFPMSGRKAWHHNIPDSWKEEEIVGVSLTSRF